MWADSEVWSKLTGNVLPPWRWELNAIVTSIAAAVHAFAIKFWALASGEGRAGFMKGTVDATGKVKATKGRGRGAGKGKGKGKAKEKQTEQVEVPDNDAAGRDTFNAWVKKYWAKWNLKDVVLKELRQGGSDPWSYMEDHNTDVVSDLSAVRRVLTLSPVSDSRESASQRPSSRYRGCLIRRGGDRAGPRTQGPYRRAEIRERYHHQLLAHVADADQATSGNDRVSDVRC